jgi:hypothetical protein
MTKLIVHQKVPTEFNMESAGYPIGFKPLTVPSEETEVAALICSMQFPRTEKIVELLLARMRFVLVHRRYSILYRI